MPDITQTFSQLLLTYGPGAMLDLPDHAVVVSGLQDWRYDANWRPIEEERLVALLRAQLGGKLSADFQGLRPPPMLDEERRDKNAPGVDVRLFPTWFVVDEASGGAEDGGGSSSEKRRRIVEFSDLSIGSTGKLTYKGDAKKTEVNPIRFVGTCAKGHLQDIDWRWLAHRNGERNCRKPLFWVERGVSSDPSDISVRCSCGASVTLADLYKPKFLGRCECLSPWLTPRRMPGETCTEDLHLLPRSATNTYFAQTVTLISLTKSNDRLRQTIAENKSVIDGIRALPNFLQVLRSIPQTKEAFKEFSDAEIASALEGDLASGVQAPLNPKIPEFDLLACGAPVIGSPAAGSFLYAETLPRDALALDAPWDAFLQNVVKVHRLREVICLYGFTRLEPPPTFAESEMDEIQLAVDGADLDRDVKWLPALEQFGEGVFLHIAATFIKDWLEKSETLEIADKLRDRERRDAQRFGRPPRHLGAAYWALHSLSHAFMAELALECGYPLSSLKERIYSSGPAQPDRFGILIYTSTAGGQGTLGGLSQMAHRAGDILARAAGRLSLCSNDPVCAEQSGENNDNPLQGAACHACLLVPETACEARNTRLDRSLLVPTLARGIRPLLAP
ncbi:DrmB family protein [Methylocystis sp. JAN1]|uniref:DrmB family protein n=1 Tax=Methylocystis sp. JAN1 TaxID=3397211 RepID=UPI003FA32BE3